MAEVVADKQEVVSANNRFFVNSIIAGFMTGVAWVVMWNLLRITILDMPQEAGAVASVVSAVLGLYILIRRNEPRPFIPVIFSGILLWSLGGVVSGLSLFESAAWALVLFIFSYSMFGVVARFKLLWLSLVVSISLVLLILLV